MDVVHRQLDDMLATKNDSALGPDGLPYSVYRCTGGIGAQILMNAYRQLLSGGVLLSLSAACRTVFIPNSATADDAARNVRSSTALRSLTFRNCDCIILTTAIDLLRSQTFSTAMRHNQANDGQYLLWLSALACLEIRGLFSRISHVHTRVNHGWIFRVLQRPSFPAMS